MGVTVGYAGRVQGPRPVANPTSKSVWSEFRFAPARMPAEAVKRGTVRTNGGPTGLQHDSAKSAAA